MKKCIVIGIAVIAAVAAYYIVCARFAATPAEERAARDAAAKSVASAGEADAVAMLEKMNSETRLRRVFVARVFPKLVRGRTYPVDFVGTLAEDLFLRLVNVERTDTARMAILKNLLDFAVRLRPELGAGEAEALRDRILDARFIVGDYDGAVELLSQGIRGKSQNWVEGTIAKVRAHEALEKEDWAGAIRNFQEFGRHLAAEPEDADPERDPTTGDLYSIELLLARNSFRQIAIFEKLGDAAGAAKAREDARAYFVKAVARAVADKDEKTAEFVRRQMADCGFAAGGN